MIQETLVTIAFVLLLEVLPFQKLIFDIFKSLMCLLEVVLIVFEPISMYVLHLSVVLVSFGYMVLDQIADQNFKKLRILALLSSE
jgi:hypothetical protein